MQLGMDVAGGETNWYMMEPEIPLDCDRVAARQRLCFTSAASHGLDAEKYPSLCVPLHPHC